MSSNTSGQERLLSKAVRRLRSLAGRFRQRALSLMDAARNSEPHSPELGAGQMLAQVADGHALLMEAVDALDIGLVLYGPGDRLIFCNKAFKDFLPGIGAIMKVGRNRVDILSDMIDAGIIPPAPGDKLAILASALSNEPGKWPLVEQSLVDGRLMRSRAKRTPSGGLVFVNVDVTEVRHREIALLEAKEKAERADRIKTEFLSNMTHELRTPMNAILGFSEMIMRETNGPLGDPHYRDYAACIHESGGYLLAIINDILDMSKYNAGRFALVEQQVDIERILGAVLRMITDRVTAAGLVLEVRVPPGPPPLMADERQIMQMLLNVTTNAIKFTPPGGRITIDGTVLPDGGYALSVTDTGIGMEAQDIPLALEPFGQVDSSLGRQHLGTGLGLPLVKSMMEAHGGSLALTSQPGEGTTVTLSFPASRVLVAA